MIRIALKLSEIKSTVAKQNNISIHHHPLAWSVDQPSAAAPAATMGRRPTQGTEM